MCIFKECGGAYLFYNEYTAITAYILVHRNYHKCEFFFSNILHAKCVVLLVIEPPSLSAPTWLVMAFLKELNLDPLGLAILKKLPRFNSIHFHFIPLKLHVLKGLMNIN